VAEEGNAAVGAQAAGRGLADVVQQGAEAQRLAPVEYTALIWAALLGWVIFSEPVSGSTIVGAAMIVAACILAARSAPARPPAVEPAI
jgi:S-adenosylmethionine uptake transporter